MGKELFTFIDNVDCIRKITIALKDKKRKVTYGTNNRLFLKSKPKRRKYDVRAYTDWYMLFVRR
jgi:hypothetical protein